jgi:hypothetical protein
MRGVLWSGFVALALSSGAALPAAAQGEAKAASATAKSQDDRQADTGRRTDTKDRVDTQRQTHVPFKAEEPAQTSRRQTEPQRQPEPQRQSPPQRQRESQPRAESRRDGDTRRDSETRRGNDSDHWRDPGPAWRSPGPAWSESRPNLVQRPGVDRFRSTSDTYAPRGGRRDDRRRGNKRHDDGVITSYPYFAPYAFAPYPYAIGEVAPEAAAPSPAAVDDEPYGFLRLRVLPRNADVHVDGELAGTVDDFGGAGERMLPAGPHRIEISAPGFAPLTFDVRVPANDTVTFSRELDPIGAAPPPTAAPPPQIPHKAVYVVPRCYIGDRPPLPSDLPAGCRVEDMRVIP